MIIIDRREPEKMVKAVLDTAAVNNIEAVVVEATYGDYILDCKAGPNKITVAIERKQLGDFRSSFIEGRVKRQLEGCRARFDATFLLIEEYPHYYQTPEGLFMRDGQVRTGLSFNSVETYLGLLPLRGVFVQKLACALDSVAWIVAMHKSLMKEHAEYQFRAGPKERDYSPAHSMLMQIPGVGPEMAGKLLAHFGSFRAFVAAGEDELRRVPGVGPALVTKITNALENGSLCEMQATSPTYRGSSRNRPTRANLGVTSTVVPPPPLVGSWTGRTTSPTSLSATSGDSPRPSSSVRRRSSPRRALTVALLGKSGAS